MRSLTHSLAACLSTVGILLERSGFEIEKIWKDPGGWYAVTLAWARAKEEPSHFQAALADIGIGDRRI